MPLDNDIPRSRLTSLIERERSSRQFPETDGAAFCRDILDHAYRRIDDPAGSRRFVLIDANACAPNGKCLHGMSFEEGYAASMEGGELVPAGRAVPVLVAGEVV